MNEIKDSDIEKLIGLDTTNELNNTIEILNKIPTNSIVEIFNEKNGFKLCVNTGKTTTLNYRKGDNRGGFDAKFRDLIILYKFTLSALKSNLRNDFKEIYKKDLDRLYNDCELKSIYMYFLMDRCISLKEITFYNNCDGYILNAYENDPDESINPDDLKTFGYIYLKSYENNGIDIFPFVNTDYKYMLNKLYVDKSFFICKSNDKERFQNEHLLANRNVFDLLCDDKIIQLKDSTIPTSTFAISILIELTNKLLFSTDPRIKLAFDFNKRKYIRIYSLSS